MKRLKENIEPMVQRNGQCQKPEKIERVWFVMFGQLRRHSRTLYIPIDNTIVRLYHLKKGDVVKYMMIELRRAPEENESIPGEL